MKLGGTPLLEFTRDRLHRETVRSGSMAGSNAAYELTSTYTPAGQLQSQHLNSPVYDRDYGWNDNGDRCASAARDRRGNTATAPRAGWRACAPSHRTRTSASRMPPTRRETACRTRSCTRTARSRRGRITASPEDAHYLYRYDEYGRLTEKTDRIPTGVIRTDDERTHHYHYDSQHRLVFTRGYSMASHWSRAATSTTRWDGEWQNGSGGGSVT